MKMNRIPILMFSSNYGSSCTVLTHLISKQIMQPWNPGQGSLKVIELLHGTIR